MAVAAVAALAALALASGVFLGLAAGDGDTADDVVGEESIDVGFARDMRDHHAQAVAMSVMVRDATSDATVRTLALDVEMTQQQQLGQMYGWLELWGLPQSGSGPRMTWMSPNAAASDSKADPGQMEGMEGMESGGSGSSPSKPGSGSLAAGQMPGMAGPGQLEQLRKARGERAERLYLQLMIPHHEAGVEMAKYAAANATQPQVRRLAQTIVDSQTSELAVLRDLLQQRGGPIPGI